LLVYVFTIAGCYTYKLGRIHAAKETGLDKDEFPEYCPWTFEQLIDDSFFPE